MGRWGWASGCGRAAKGAAGGPTLEVCEHLRTPAPVILTASPGMNLVFNAGVRVSPRGLIAELNGRPGGPFFRVVEGANRGPYRGWDRGPDGGWDRGVDVLYQGQFRCADQPAHPSPGPPPRRPWPPVPHERPVRTPLQTTRTL